MATEVRMPKLGMTMTEGQLMRWEKAEGDPVAQGETLFSINTNKTSADIDAPAAGVLLKILCPEGDTVPVGALVGWIGEAGEALPDAPTSSDGPGTGAAPTAARTPAQDTPRPEAAGLRATPAARAVARQKGVALAGITGTGPLGRILRKDVEAALAAGFTAPAAAAAAYEDITPPPIQKLSAARMTESFAAAPHFYLTIRVEVTAMKAMLGRARAAMAQNPEGRPTFTDVLLWVLSRVIPRHPRVNAEHRGETIRLWRGVNLGIAADTGGGLVVPVLRGANEKSFSEIVAERQRLVAGAREGRLSPDDMAGGTFTVSNLGMYGVSQFQAILNPPQSALLAVGAAEKVPALENGQLVEKEQLTLSLSCDHRVLDGVAGAKFLQELKAVMEKPDRLLDAHLF